MMNRVHKDSTEKTVRDVGRATRRRYSAQEKIRIVLQGLRGDDSIAELYRKKGINQNLYYCWPKEPLEAGKKRLAGDTTREATSDEVKGLRQEALGLKEVVVELLMENRPLKAQDLITSPAYILIQASVKFQQPTTRANQMWQTDFSYLKVIGWGWYYLPTVLDDYSRFIVAWCLCSSMPAWDVPDALAQALEFTGMDQVRIKHKPRLLSDSGPSYVAAELKTYLMAQR